MTHAHEWGRTTKGSLPSGKYVWSRMALFLSVIIFLLCSAIRLHMDLNGLQRWYLGQYLRSGFVRSFQLTDKGTGNYRFLQLNYGPAAKRAERLATASDLSISAASNGTITAIHYAKQWTHRPDLSCSIATVQVSNVAVHEWLRQAIYDGDELGDLLNWLLKAGGICGCVVLLAVLPFAWKKDRQRAELRRNGRRLRGSRLLTTCEFNARFGGDGVGWINEVDVGFWRKKAPVLRIPCKDESHHFLNCGSTGTGKTVVQTEYIWQCDQRNECVMVYDPDGYFLSRFYRQGRGDVIINPLDMRGIYWNPGDEVRDFAEALVVATAFFPDVPGSSMPSAEYFHGGARKVLARLLCYHPTPEELTHWMSTPEEIERRLAQTPEAQIMSEAPGQRAGILGALANGANSFALLTTSREAAERNLPHWNSRQWAANPKGWIFLTSKTDRLSAIRPIASAIFDLCILRLLSRSSEARIPVSCVLDELASLNYLPQLHLALTQARRFNLKMVVGFQDKGQLETRYGREATTLIGMPKTKIYLRTGDASAARWASENLGDIEVERISESSTHGRHNGSTETLQHTTERLVLPSEIQSLPDRHGYLQYEGCVVPISFPYRDLPIIAPAFIERQLPDEQHPDELDLSGKNPPPDGSVPSPKLEQGNTPFFS